MDGHGGYIFVFKTCSAFQEMSSMLHVYGIFLCLMYHVGAIVVIQDTVTNDTVEFDLYNALPWPVQVDQLSLYDGIRMAPNASTLAGIPLISLHEAIGEDFNPCDASTFHPGALKTAIERVTKNEFASSEWIGYFDGYNIACSTNPLHLYYTPYMALFAQQLGAR